MACPVPPALPSSSLAHCTSPASPAAPSPASLPQLPRRPVERGGAAAAAGRRGAAGAGAARGEAIAPPSARLAAGDAWGCSPAPPPPCSSQPPAAPPSLSLFPPPPPLPGPVLQEFQLQDVMQEMQQRLESGGAVGMADYEASRQRIAALTLHSPGTPQGEGAGTVLCCRGAPPLLGPALPTRPTHRHAPPRAPAHLPGPPPAVVDQLAAGFREEDWATLVQRSRLHRTTTECRLQWTNSLAPSLRWGRGLQGCAVSLACMHGHGPRHGGQGGDRMPASLAPRLACLQPAGVDCAGGPAAAAPG